MGWFAQIKSPLDENVVSDVKSTVEITMIDNLCVVIWLIVNSPSVELMGDQTNRLRINRRT